MQTTVDKKSPIPRYLQVRAIIEQPIRSGSILPGGRLLGERELAKELKVSQMTVNKAIASLVRDGWLRREVGNGTFVMEDLQVPAPPHVTVGFAIPYREMAEEDYYLSALLRGIQRATCDKPVSLKVLETSRAPLFEKVQDAQIDGLILVDVLQHCLEDVRRLSEQGRRLLILGASHESLDLPCVDSDNVAGTRTAMHHFLALGHRRVAGAFAYMGMCNSQQRYQTYCEILRENGMEVDPKYLLDLGNGEALRSETREEFIQLLQSSNRPTAILCGGFFVALEMMQVVRQAGMRIPEDVSLVGFDDPVAARYLTPPLTTVRQPLEDMGAHAMDLMFSWLQNGTVPPTSTVLAESFVVRSSSARANGDLSLSQSLSEF